MENRPPQEAMLLKEYLDKYRLTQTEFALSCSISTQIISSCVRTGHASIKNARKIEAATKNEVTFEELRQKASS